ncbi:hypothetical protein BU15DRAFT_66028 [Melanogaster broomeanus]|nr:hypothetical protein BU15DRAFT_66028 [Melanogaster broomeanus]
MQEIVVLKERCKTLEIRLLQVHNTSATLSTPQAPPSPRLPSCTRTCDFGPKPSTPTGHAHREAIADPRWKVAFLEPRRGKPIPDDTIKAIRKKLRGGWPNWSTRRWQPQTWARPTHPARNSFRRCCTSFPILQLSENDWKLDYPLLYGLSGWARNNMDALGNWPASRESKQEVSANTDEELVPGASKKRKAKWCKSEAAEKKFQVHPRFHHPQPASEFSSNTSQICHATQASGSPAAVPAGTSVPSISTPSSPAASHEAEVSTSGSVVADNQSNLEENLPTSNTIAASSVVANPLAILSKNVLKLTIPPVLPIPINMTEEKKKQLSNRKMRPTKNKTGYNLCAWRWITQINENGTSEEFRDYWFKQLAYKDEATGLTVSEAL